MVAFVLAVILATSSAIAVGLCYWLRAISEWKYYYALCGFIIGTFVAWLSVDLFFFRGSLFGVTPDPWRKHDIVDLVFFQVLGISYRYQIPLYILIGAPAILPLIATVYAIRFRARPEEKQPGRFSSIVLCLGLGVVAAVLVTTIGPIAWHLHAVRAHRANETNWRGMGAFAEYSQGRLTGLSFLKGTNPPWELITREPDLGLLSFSNCRVTDQDVKHLIGLCSLWELHLDGTEVTDACIPDLERIPALRNLSIHDTRITADGVKRLQERLEPRRIQYSPRRRASPTTPAR